MKALLLESLRALFASEGSISAEVIVIDNASQDGTVEAIHTQFPQVRVIANHRNVGFARANMQGMLAMRARHCLLLNPDMRVENDAVSKTVSYLDAHTDVAVLGARLSKPDGQGIPSVRRFPTLGSQLAILFKLPRFIPSFTRHYLATDMDYALEQEVDSVRGSFFAIHRRALDALGGLDTRYFIWFEEVDYCKRAVSQGWKVMYVPTIRAVDYIGQSFAKRATYWKQRQFTKSMAQYFFAWHPWWQGMVIAILRTIPVAAAWITDHV